MRITITFILLSCAFIGAFSISDATYNCTYNLASPCQSSPAGSDCNLAHTKQFNCTNSCQIDGRYLQTFVDCYTKTCVSTFPEVQTYWNTLAACYQAEIDSTPKSTSTFTATVKVTGGIIISFSLSLIITSIVAIIF